MNERTYKVGQYTITEEVDEHKELMIRCAKIVSENLGNIYRMNGWTK